MPAHRCTCADRPVHSTPAACAANRAATAAYMSATTAANIAGGIARGERLAADHAAHLTPVYGCAACPLDGRFRRDSAAGEWYVPQG
jgi:hypothetical protein